MAQRYMIKTVGDFLQVPRERLSDCLGEFEAALEIAMATRDVSKILDKDAPFSFRQFEWIDDNKKNASITLVPNDSKD